MSGGWKTALLGMAGGGLLAAGAGGLMMAAPPVVVAPPVGGAPTVAVAAAASPAASSVAAPKPGAKPSTEAKAADPGSAAAPKAAAGAAKPGQVADLFGLSPRLPEAAPAEGGPPSLRWSVQIGLYPTAALAEAARTRLGWLVTPPEVSQWKDRRGQIWFTLSLTSLTAPGAADTVARLRQKGWDPVRATALPVPASPMALAPSPAQGSSTVAEAVPGSSE